MSWFDKHKFTKYFLIFLTLLLITIILYKSVPILNYNLFVFRLFSILLIVSIVFTIIYFLKVFKGLSILYSNQENLFKILFWVIIVLLLINVYINLENYSYNTKKKIDSIQFSRINPIDTSNIENDGVSEIKTTSVKEGKVSNGVSFIDKVKRFFSELTSSASNCPQLNVPLEDAPKEIMWNHEKAIFLNTNIYNGWQIKKFSPTSDALNFAMYMDTQGIACIKGSSAGNNINYFYCTSIQRPGLMGLGTYKTPIPYIEKTPISNDGTIGETIRKSFRNIYDTDGNFIRTECFSDPIVQDRKNFEALVKELSSYQ